MLHMILVIDNYDSFVHNLARYVGLAGYDYDVVRNDEITIEAVRRINPHAVLLSPGPKAPKDSGICIELIKQLGHDTPMLGVCLGHQCIGEAFGGTTIRADEPVHGKASLITHDGSELFTGVPKTFRAGRYHSLVTEVPSGAALTITARNEDGQIMALQHKTAPVYGVQFHPESVLTEYGLDLISNFCAIAADWRKARKRAA
jgi:para-aminobenzoate synthetase component 2